MIIKNNDSRLIVIGDIKLLPGCNGLTEDEEKFWKEFTTTDEKVPNVYNIKYLNIEVSDENFNVLDIKQKEKILTKTFNIKTLEKWAEAEPDASIRNQILTRIEGIKKADIKVVNEYGKPKNHV
jgi:hypothetical protein